MSNRLIAFIIAVLLAAASAFAQNDQLVSVTERELEAPTITANDQFEPVKISETVTDLTPPTPPVMEEPKPVSIQETSAAQPTTNGVNIGLSADVRQKGASILNKLLADEFVLYTKTLKFHWNVQGIVFHDFHEMFKAQYEKLFDIVDLVAERARALGAPALGSLQEFTTFTRLKEVTTQKLAALEMIKALLADHEEIIRTIRNAIDTTAQLGDQGTSNFLQDLIIKHEKLAWMRLRHRDLVLDFMDGQTWLGPGYHYEYGDAGIGDGGTFQYTVTGPHGTPIGTPEPGTLAFLGVPCALFFWGTRRRRGIARATARNEFLTTF